MSDGSWQQVVEDYKFAQKESWGEDYLWMEKLVLHLLENRDLSTLYPITSHYRPIAFIGQNFGEKYKKPKISIQLSQKIFEHGKDKFRYKFSLHTGHEDDDLFREFGE